MDRKAWHAAVHAVAKSWSLLSDWIEVLWGGSAQNYLVKLTLILSPTMDIQILSPEWGLEVCSFNTHCTRFWCNSSTASFWELLPRIFYSAPLNQMTSTIVRRIIFVEGFHCKSRSYNNEHIKQTLISKKIIKQRAMQTFLRIERTSEAPALRWPPCAPLISHSLLLPRGYLNPEVWENAPLPSFSLKLNTSVLPPNNIFFNLGWLGILMIFFQLLVCCYSVAKSHLTLHDPVDCSMPGFPVPYHLLEFAQVHVHWNKSTWIHAFVVHYLVWICLHGFISFLDGHLGSIWVWVVFFPIRNNATMNVFTLVEFCTSFFRAHI